MKKVFYVSVTAIALFEILKVFFIMPMPGSQEINSLDVAYFLHSYRWYFRVVLGVMIIISAPVAFQNNRWLPAAALLITLSVAYFFNFEMLADKMFRQPAITTFETQTGNQVSDSSVVIGVEYNGEARAYPIRFILYHHQVQDTVGGKSMIVTYCNVCRTGRIFDPTVNGHHEKFRLVGMDHFNAMFEDETTKSWWRQATGEAVAGSLRGKVLPEIESSQMVLKKWLALYPSSLVMQGDEGSKVYYDSLGKFESGRSKGKLTRTDSASWNDKSWIVGVLIDTVSKAYDWNQLREERIINDNVGGVPIVIALSDDNQSFTAFERPVDAEKFSVSKDTIYANGASYDFSGRDLGTLTSRLKKVKVYQEFWHSWRTFHPNTKRYM